MILNTEWDNTDNHSRMFYNKVVGGLCFNLNDQETKVHVKGFEIISGEIHAALPATALS